MSRTRKQAYRKSRVFAVSCRNHGRCGWCRGNRLHKHVRMAKPGELVRCGYCGEFEPRCYCYHDGSLDPWEGLDGN